MWEGWPPSDGSLGASVGKGHAGKWLGEGPGDLALPPANHRTRAQRTQQVVREQIREDEKSVALGQTWLVLL